MSLLNAARTIASSLGLPSVTKGGKFLRRFQHNLDACTWEPHPLYNVFTQYDGSHYLAQRDAFLGKYKAFWAVSRTISPKRIIEMGTHAGSSADAYLSATPTAEYFGFDFYGSPWWKGARHEQTGEPWRPKAVAERLLTERGYRFTIYDADLRSYEKLPVNADFAVVDAAHDYDNALADMRLALTAEPSFIFIDDYVEGVAEAGRTFLEENRGRVEFTAPIPYAGGGLVVRLKGAA